MPFRPKNISVWDWVAILPQLAALVGTTIAALRDGQVTKEEGDKILADFVALCASVS